MALPGTVILNKLVLNNNNSMKNNSIKLLLSILPLFSFAQTAIGKTSVSNPSVSLEFGNGKRGLILPYVSTLPTNAVPGILLMSVSEKTIKVATNAGTWFNLSKNEQNVTFGGITIPDTTGSVDVSDQIGLTEVPVNKSVIGAQFGSDTTPGALVLSDNNKAMILPRVASPHLSIINPAPGMMAYDTVTNQLAIFNGTVWTFWKS